MPLIDLTGHRYGQLVVIGRHIPQRHPNTPEWICLCDCGTKTIVFGGNLRRGLTRSCGCRSRGYIHGRSDTPLWQRWQTMLQRCLNPQSAQYSYYGGRGITVCDRWRTFESFAADMGEPPSSAHSIERISNEKGYGPDNCRWATRLEQMRNTRANHWVEFGGERLVITDWAARLGIKPMTLLYRLRNWPFDRAMTETAHRHST